MGFYSEDQANLRGTEHCQGGSISGVRSVHDLHVWTIGSGKVASTCHLVMDELTLSEAQAIQEAARRILFRKFGITHSTFLIEVEGCDPNLLWCQGKDVEEFCGEDDHEHVHEEGQHPPH